MKTYPPGCPADPDPTTSPTPAPQDGAERKLVLVDRIAKRLLGPMGSYQRMITVIVLAVLAAWAAPKVFGDDDSDQIAQVIRITTRLARSINRLECAQAGGTRATCLTAFPPLDAPEAKP